MRRAVAAIIVCSLGALVAPLRHSPPAALAVHEKDAGDSLFNWQPPNITVVAFPSAPQWCAE